MISNVRQIDMTAAGILIRASSLFGLLVLGSLLLVGCGGKSFPMGEVEGVVLLQGQPAAGLFVQFIPDVTGENAPPTSNGKTDENGHFTLNVIEADGSVLPGAAVGSYRVVLRDIEAAEAGGGARRMRLPSVYTMPGSTPLRQEVKEGKQSIEIQLPPR